MSSLLKAAKRHGRNRIKFKFEMTIHRIQIFKERDKILFRFVWSKQNGKRSQTTQWQEGMKRIEVDSRLCLFATLFERKSQAGAFQEKMSRLTLEMRTERESSRTIKYGHVDLNLADFAALTDSDALDARTYHKQLNFTKTKDKKAYVAFTIHSVALVDSQPSEDMEMSAEMSGSRTLTLSGGRTEEDGIDSDHFLSREDDENKEDSELTGVGIPRVPSTTPVLEVLASAHDVELPRDNDVVAGRQRSGSIHDESLWDVTEEDRLRRQITEYAMKEADLVEQMNEVRKENKELKNKLRKAQVEVEQLKRQISAKDHDPNTLIRASVLATKKSPKKTHVSRRSMSYEDQLQNVAQLKILSMEPEDSDGGDDSLIIHAEEAEDTDSEHEELYGEPNNTLENDLHVSEMNSKLWSHAVKRMSTQLEEDVLEEIHARSSKTTTKSFLSNISQELGMDDEDTQEIIEKFDTNPSMNSSFHSRTQSYESDVILKLQEEFTSTVAEKMKMERQYEDEKERADMLQLEISKYEQESTESKEALERVQRSYDDLTETLSQLERKYVQVKFDYVNMVDRYHTLEYHQEKLVEMIDGKQKKGKSGRVRRLSKSNVEKHLKSHPQGRTLGTIATGNLNGHRRRGENKDGNEDDDDDADMILID